MNADPKCVIGVYLRSSAASNLRYFLWDADLFLLLEEGHHFTQFPAHFFDGLIARFFAHGEKLVAPGLVLRDPLPGKLARLNLRQNLLHFGARLLVDDART